MIEKFFATESTGWKRAGRVVVEFYAALWIGFLFGFILMEVVVATLSFSDFSSFTRPQDYPFLLALPFIVTGMESYILTDSYYGFLMLWPLLPKVIGTVMLWRSVKTENRFAGFMLIILSGAITGGLFCLIGHGA